MARYLEYETDTGHIISELTSSSKPESSEGIDYLQIEDDLLIDTTLYAVKNGSLVKGFETNEERLEREKVKREQAEKIRLRLKSMIYEYVLALMDENEEAISELKAEYQKLKVYL